LPEVLRVGAAKANTGNCQRSGKVVLDRDILAGAGGTHCPGGKCQRSRRVKVVHPRAAIWRSAGFQLEPGSSKKPQQLNKYNLRAPAHLCSGKIKISAMTRLAFPPTCLRRWPLAAFLPRRHRNVVRFGKRNKGVGRDPHGKGFLSGLFSIEPIVPFRITRRRLFQEGNRSSMPIYVCRAWLSCMERHHRLPIGAVRALWFAPHGRGTTWVLSRPKGDVPIASHRRSWLTPCWPDTGSSSLLD
jgi:hypothetical protein